MVPVRRARVCPLLTIKHSAAQPISLFAATSTLSVDSDSAANCARAQTRARISKSGFYAVKDRIFGPEADAAHPDQGGSSFYVDGVHYFKNGFIAAADVNITSNLAFRQVFSDKIQDAISPEETSQVFVNKNHNEYSFNFLARTQVTSLENARIRIRQLPSISIDKRPGIVSFFKSLPLYFSFSGEADGVSRKETVEDQVQFVNDVGGNPIISPSIVQRLDLHPRFELPLNFAGWTITASGAGRVTFYSNSLDPATRDVLSRNITRSYGEFELDVRPPAFAKDFRRGGGFFFRHVIEPYMIYRKISGINNFDRIIRFDYIDAIADTNEIEFGIANRFFTRRSTENVSDVPVKADRRREPAFAFEPAVRSTDDHAAWEILFRSVFWRRAADEQPQPVLSDKHAFGFCLRWCSAALFSGQR